MLIYKMLTTTVHCAMVSMVHLCGGGTTYPVPGTMVRRVVSYNYAWRTHCGQLKGVVLSRTRRFRLVAHCLDEFERH
ncbi:hypothetical protein F443_23116 [Phytophthora nicotianae P1569]|uniref:Secreted protein n=1 Tax=Phytophthora nicotianae P1569 TaxID=1317065 RepID=V9DUR7_PHYNI|nr:hypothetical protein F443_23116 [Phytophthora nicotianae P1569]